MHTAASTRTEQRRLPELGSTTRATRYLISEGDRDSETFSELTNTFRRDAFSGPHRTMQPSNLYSNNFGDLRHCEANVVGDKRKCGTSGEGGHQSNAHSAEVVDCNPFDETEVDD